MEAKRIFDIPELQLKKYPKQDALARKEEGKWITYSTEEVISESKKLALGLIELGLGPQDKIAIISFNRPEWNFTDLAIQQIGGVSVPIYPTITEQDYNYIFKDAEVKMVFVENQELYEKVEKAIQDISGIEAIYTYDKIEGKKHWSELKTDGNEDSIKKYEQWRNAVNKEDLLTLIYTSGTTGAPKGVMLTHHNLVSNIESCRPAVPVDETCKALSFLPLCHIYERMLTYLYMSYGVSIYYAESMETIGDNLKEVHPNIFTTVPRLLEKVYDKIYAKGLELKGIKKALFFWALDLGLKFDLHKNQGFWYNFQLKLANKLIFSKWRDALGGNIKCIVSGSAALQPRLAKVFWAARIPVMEGYGLTETSPVISVNRINPEEHMIGTIGPIVDGVEVKIAPDGEILFRGPNLMKGYYNKPDETAKAIDSEGWFHTGDKGEFVQRNKIQFLKITGRVKEIFKTSGGKYIAPQLIENKFKESVLIEQLMVIGENRKFPSALIVPSFPNLREYCEHKGIEYTSDAEMIKHPDVLDKYEREKDRLNESFAKYEKIKQIRLMPAEWTIDNGELTPTLKCKRRVIMEKYKEYIDDIYEREYEVG